MTADEKLLQAIKDRNWYSAVYAAAMARTSEKTPEQIADETMALWEMAEAQATIGIERRR